MKTISPLIGGHPNCSSSRIDGERPAAGTCRRPISESSEVARRSLGALLIILIAANSLPSGVAVAQDVGRSYIQAGAGAIPGIGVQGGYVSPASFYTVEGILYVDGSPPFAGGQGSIQVSGGLGGAIRILGIVRTVGSPGYEGRDFDVGLRFGPSLFFTVGQSSRDENPFSLFLEPFLRATSTFRGDHIFFAELGIQRPILRAGIWFAL